MAHDRRSTGEILVLVVGTAIAAEVVLALVGVVVVTLVRPEVDTSRFVEVVGGQVTLVIGAALGYLSARGAQKSEHHKGDST